MTTHRVLTCYYRPKPGGFCKRLFRAINALLDCGHTVHYLAVVPFPIHHPNCHFHRFPWPQNLTSGLLFWGVFHTFAPICLLYLGFLYRIDRLFAFGHNYALFMQPLRIAKRIPLTLFLRADTIENHRLQGRSLFLLRLELMLEALAIYQTRLYGVSEVLIRHVTARHTFLQAAVVDVLRNDVSLPKEELREKHPSELPLRLGCVGILEARKNQKFLLEIMENIPKEQVQLFLYGTGPDEQLLQELSRKKKLSDRVHFMGWVDSDEIWPNIDLLLMPSLHEGSPNAVLEAIGNRVPVLASDIPEHREVVPRCCLRSLDSVEEWHTVINRDLCSLAALFSKMNDEQISVSKLLGFDWDGAISDIITG